MRYILKNNSKGALAELELRKLEKDYQRCIQADMKPEIDHFSWETPYLDQLRQQQPKTEEKEKEDIEWSSDEEDEQSPPNNGYAQLNEQEPEKNEGNSMGEIEQEQEIKTHQDIKKLIKEKAAILDPKNKEENKIFEKEKKKEILNIDKKDQKIETKFIDSKLEDSLNELKKLNLPAPEWAKKYIFVLSKFARL